MVEPRQEGLRSTRDTLNVTVQRLNKEIDDCKSRNKLLEKAGKDGLDLMMKDKEALRIERDDLAAKENQLKDELIKLRDLYNDSIKELKNDKVSIEVQKERDELLKMQQAMESEMDN